MQVRLLGPVDLAMDGTAQPVPGLRLKAVLAALALHAGEVVSTDRLIDMVWGERAPVTATNTLQVHVSKLRGLLGKRGAILARAPGYLLHVDGEATDVTAAERLIHQGVQCRDPQQGAERLQEAVDLWRGPPLADVAGLDFFDEQAQRLNQLRLRARCALIEARLALGQHERVVAELEGLRREHPFHEQIHELLMLALYRSGRQADALATYQILRRALNEELGIDPGRSTSDLESAILRQDPFLDLGPVGSTAGPAPAQLPAGVASFVGRAGELAQLDELLTPGAGPATAVIGAVSGTAGVGKTALAVHWAHRVASHFPDGQLYVNLRGFDPDGATMAPQDAIRGFLHAFAVPVERIPADLNAQVGLFRSVLAGKRVLLVLDNARDVEHVRPLLPGAPGCLAVVTSRTRLTPLVATEGAAAVALDLLSDAEGCELLARRVGGDRVAAAPAVAREVIARCARLPLALAIFAAQAASQPRQPLAALAHNLRTAGDALDALDAGDRGTDLRGVFSWSYQTLSTDAKTLFRLLGMHVGPDVTIAAAASLAAVPRRRAAQLLTQLAQANLLTEPAPGRYACHDLLRAYARELVHTDDGDGVTRPALGRIVDHYLHTAYAGTRLLDANQPPTTPPEPGPGVTVDEHVAGERALAWFTAERTALMGVVRLAAAEGLAAHAWQLAAALTVFLDRLGHWDDLATAHHAALRAASDAGDRAGQASCLRGLGLAAARLGRLDDTYAHTRAALDLSLATGDRNGQARAHLTLAWVRERQDRRRDALSHGHQALRLYEATGNGAGQARALSSLGCNHVLLGDHREALGWCERALALHRQANDRTGEANTWHSLGDVHHRSGDHAQAVACHQRAVDLYRQLADRHNEATSLHALGDSCRARGDLASAEDAWRQAREILAQLSRADADPTLG
jgi:DNA-binding SARP family transcriptional activator